MKRKCKQALTLSVLLALGGGSQAWAADFSVTQLEVNHMQAPMGLDETQPVFGWRMVLPEKASPSAEKGKATAQRQTAYELLVTDESGKLLWDSGRVKASASQEIAYGGNDPRLMEAGKNLWGLSNGKDESWVQLVLDVSGLDAHPDGQAQLRVYRQGYSTKDDAERPLGEFAVSRQAVNEQNCHEPHRLWLTSNHGIL